MKLNKKWIAVILLVVMALCLTACGEKKEEAKPAEAAKPTIVGVWEMEKETLLNTFGLTDEAYEEAKAEFGYIAITYEFTADGKVIATEISGEEKQVIGETTYIVDGNNITIDGDKSTYKIDGNKLFVTDDSTAVTMVFNRK